MSTAPRFLERNRAGSRPPLVCVHTWARSEPPFLTALADALGDDQPLYALAAPDAPDVLLGIETVDDWVAWHRPALDHLPIDPPYRLVGWSMGGVVAVELARTLLADDVAVVSIGMIDAWLPTHRPREPIARLGWHLEVLAGESRAERVAHVGDLARKAARKVGRKVSRRLFPKPAPAGKGVDPASRSIWVPHLKYRARPVPPGPMVTVFASQDSTDRHDGDATLGWAPWLQHGYSSVVVPGDHWSLWAPDHIDVLAAALRPDPR